MLDGLVSMTNKIKGKQDDDTTQQVNNDDPKETTSSTYKQPLPFPQCLKNENINTANANILEIFK